MSRLRFIGIAAACLLLGGRTARTEVWVYPAPDAAFSSSHYQVTVEQDGRSYDSFVFQHAHQDPDLAAKGSDFNHWTTFSFSGRITVVVRRLDGADAQGDVLPAERRISTITSGDTLRFSLDRPEKLYVRFPGAQEHPLFLFADEPETNVPDRNDPNVLWFEAGKVHDIGERFLLKTGQTVYIPGGAYVRGTLAAEGASDLTVRGRGVLSGLGYPRRPGPQSIPYNSIMFNGPGQRQTVEGITVTNPQHFCLLSRGTLAARNVKLFGWWHQTDGWGGGDGSSIEDSFIKVNDDSVKLYGRNQTARRLVIYQQVNGAPFQLGWGGATQAAFNCLVEDIDLVACDAADKTQREANQAFLNLRRQSPESTIDGITLRRIRIDCDIPMLVGFLEVKGTVKNILFEEVSIKGTERGSSFIRTQDDGVVEGVTLRGVSTSDGQRLHQAETQISTTGKVSGLSLYP
jgi:hypothetical protein